MADALCDDCPPSGYPNKTRCLPCPRRDKEALRWHDASIFNSPYEQQTDGERYRHRLPIATDWVDGRAPDMPAEITIKDMEGCTLAHAAHLDGPRGKGGWFGDLFRVVQYPRLARLDRRKRDSETVDVVWIVDGNLALEYTLGEAVWALNTPPVLTAEETIVLKLVTWEYQDLREKTRNLGMAPLMGLRDKGVIEFAEGKCRLRKNALFVPVAGGPAVRPEGD